ncbi:MAG TPA: S-layer protein, partial [Mesotoga prima]|nr:S-layer protein [Mesotoga prima]
MKKTILVFLSLFLAISLFGIVSYDLQKVIIVPEEPQGGLEVSIWLDRDIGSLYYSGEEVKTYFKVNKDAYV